MSSTSSQRLGLYLYVNYRGQKVHRHFTNFTDDSAQVFRDDLLEMRFALPKTINTWLMARGCVVGFWPDVSADKVCVPFALCPHHSHPTSKLYCIIISRER